MDFDKNGFVISTGISEENTKVNVKLSLCFTKYHAMKTYVLN
jgi:hypothetical protein